MTENKCPKCGADLQGIFLTVLPPIHINKCPVCGYEEKDEPDKKPPLGCKPYYVAISERVDELCSAIGMNMAEAGKHNQVKLWVTEIILLNEMDRILRRVEAEKTWVEDKDGTLKEVE